MENKCISLVIVILFSLTVFGKQSGESTNNYGDATVSSVLRLDEHARLYCNIPEFPAVIGKNIPVCINALKPAENAQDNLKLLMYLNDLLLSKTSRPKNILLKNIRRGQTFCLIADVYVDGKNLSNLLVQQKLARKIIEVPQQSKLSNTEERQEPAKDPTISAPIASGEYVASKSSKVFHRITCLHANRMNASKALHFASLQKAEQSGRRPCKTCKP